jgi:hypothetical protein
MGGMDLAFSCQFSSIKKNIILLSTSSVNQSNPLIKGFREMQIVTILNIIVGLSLQTQRG